MNGFLREDLAHLADDGLGELVAAAGGVEDDGAAAGEELAQVLDLGVGFRTKS